MPAEMQPVEIPNSTWKKIGIDLIGPFKDIQGQPGMCLYPYCSSIAFVRDELNSPPLSLTNSNGTP
jgi:hypothetical protein